MKKWVLWIVYILVTLLLFVAGTLFLLSTSWSRDYRREKARLKKRGIPVTAEELRKEYTKRNPKRKRYRLNSLPSPLSTITTRYRDLRTDKGFTRKKAARKIAPRIKKHQKKIDRILSRKYFPAKFSFQKGLPLKNDHLQYMNEAGTFLKVYALSLYVQGNVKEAVRALEKGYKIAESMRKQPVLLNFLVHLAILGNMNSVLKEVLRSSKPVPREFERLFPYLTPEFVGEDKIFVLQGELCLGLITLQKVINGRKRIWTGMKGGYVENYLPNFVWKKWWVNYSKMFQKYLLAIKKPYYKGKPQVKKYRKRVEKMSNGLSAYMNYPTVLLMPAIGSFYAETTKKVAEAKVLNEALDWRLSQQSGSGGATGLPDLSSTTDPVTGKPLKLKKNKKTFVIYSIGINQKDDGGKSYPPDVDKDDIGVELPLPESK